MRTSMLFLLVTCFCTSQHINALTPHFKSPEPSSLRYSHGYSTSCNQSNHKPCPSQCPANCAPKDESCTPEVTCDYPTICYVPYCYQVPKYNCVQKCENIPVYRNKRICKMVPKYYDKTCWKYVPVSYVKKCCRYEPQYSCVKELSGWRKQNHTEWQCKYEPRYFYKKMTCSQGKSACDCLPGSHALPSSEESNP